MKLHICCGDVYLKDYVNIDIEGVMATEVTPQPTTLQKYYTKPFSVEFNSRPRGQFIIDKKMNILEKWDFPDSSTQEIVMISAIEHFTPKQAEFIVNEARRVLKEGGEFIFDFPDLPNQILKYYYTNPEFLMELIYCNNKNDHSKHMWGYTPETARKLLGHGWRDIYDINVVKHDYPMHGILAERNDNVAKDLAVSV
jgi:hypothetical protein